MDTGPAARKASRDKTRKGLADDFPFEMSPAGHRPDREERSPVRRGASRRPWTIGIVCVGVLVALAWGIWMVWAGR